MVKSGTVLYVKEEPANSDGVLENPYALFASTIFGPMPLEKNRPVTAIEVGDKDVVPTDEYQNGETPKVNKKNVFVPTSRYPNGETPKPGDKVEVYGLFKKSICKKGQIHHGFFSSSRTLDGKVIKVEIGEEFVPGSDGAISKYHLYTVQTDIGNVLCNGDLRIHNEGESVEVREILRRWSNSPSYSLKD